jgi:uncharacterized protein YqeY
VSEDLKSRLRDDLKAALKSGESARLGTVRMLLSEFRNKEIEKGRALSDDEGLALVASGIKSRQESVEQFRKAGREELVAKEGAEIDVLRSYLPEQLSDVELAELVDQALAETGAASPREMGRVMGWLMPRIRGRAEGTRVSRLVKEKLGG